MLVLVSPHNAGTKPGDFIDTIPGELVCRPGCDTCPPAQCACKTPWTGITSGKETTLAAVSDLLGIDRIAYFAIIRGHLTARGWTVEQADNEAEALALIAVSAVEAGAHVTKVSA